MTSPSTIPSTPSPVISTAPQKERPILFTAAMVRSILSGEKTETRRRVKFTANHTVKETGSHRNWHPEDPHAIKACPYGQQGDKLWVKETFGHPNSNPQEGIVYRATDPSWDNASTARCRTMKWLQSILMSREYSRIELQIEHVRIERLHEISAMEVEREGLHPSGNNGLWTFDAAGVNARLADYADLWNSINGPNAWAENPLVWVILFQTIKQEL